MSCRPVVLQIHDTDAGGITTFRSWTVCAHDAEHVSSLLGEPETSMMATADAVETANRTLLATPGVVLGGQPS